MTDEQPEKALRFRALHEGPAFVMPNPWDAGSARLLSSLGFDALATTSAGYAFARGKRDSAAALTRDELLANAAEIVAATDLPVSADLEDGFGRAPDACAQTIRMAVDIGLAGGSIEDATGDPNDPILDVGLATERIEAAAEITRANNFVLTARAENHLWGQHDLKDTIMRLQRFAEAGAEVLYAPGLPDLSAIRTVCDAVDRPVNVVMGLSGPRFSVTELAAVGVRRISLGGSLARAALGAVLRAAQEVRTHGTFDYAADAISDHALRALMSSEQPAVRG